VFIEMAERENLTARQILSRMARNAE